MHFMTALSSYGRKGLALAAIGLTATVAACNDAPSSPKSTTTLADAGSTPAQILVGTFPATTATLQIRRAYDSAYVSGTVRVTNANGWKLDVTDNQSGDGDSRLGYVKVNIPVAAWYTARIVAVNDPSVIADTSQVKGVAPSNPYAPVGFGTFWLNRAPVVDVRLYKDGNLLPGVYLRVYRLGTSQTFDIVDGDPPDMNWNFSAPLKEGRIIFYAPAVGTYLVCALSQPFGYSAPCAKVEVKPWPTWNMVQIKFEPEIPA